MRNDLGRHVLGAAAIFFGLIGLTWHDIDNWQQLRSLWNIGTFGATLVYLAAIAQIAGGLAIEWRRTARLGGLVLCIVYLFFALRWVPTILATPRSFDGWGNFFEQFSLVSGALIVYGSHRRDSPAAERVRQIGRCCFGICVVSFTLEQLVYLSATADFVPKWIPPGQMFWAILTTVAMALAAAAILSGVWALLASWLLTAMCLGFGLLIWLPRVIADPRDHTNWAANAEDLAITAAAWVVADYLALTRAPSLRRSAGIVPNRGS
jgi:uncharacterized membrane protein YphA (DoxX/SURF4 family)